MKKIDKKNVVDLAALSPLQEGILFHYLKNPDSEIYFEQLSLFIEGIIDVKMFERTWEYVLAANEMLRTVFRWGGVEKPVQIILKEHHLDLRHHDFSKIEKKEAKELLEVLKTKDRQEGFDLTEVPFRVTLCKFERDRYEVIISSHHILYDGWSNGIILKEFFLVYDSLLENRNFKKPKKNRFFEYVKWLGNQTTGEQEEYWQNYLKGIETKTILPLICGEKGADIIPRTCDVELGNNLDGKLGEFVKRNRLSLSAIFYCAYGIVLQKYNNIGDVIFGSTVSGRSAKLEGIEDIVGLFINTIPLRIKAGSGEKALDLLKKVNRVLQEREEYENTSLLKIKECSQFDHTEALFDSIVVIENYPLDNILTGKKSHLTISSYDMFEINNYDLTVSITLPGTIDIRFIYNNGLFEQAAVERLSHHFVNILEDIVDNPGKKVSAIDILSPEEKRQLLFDFNDTGGEYPGDKTIHELFMEQVGKTPDTTAVVGFGQDVRDMGTKPVQLTYREFDRETGALTSILIKKGVGPGTIAAVMVERSIAMVTTIFAILKTGGAYLPIDPEYPEERKQYIIKDSGAKLLSGELASGPAARGAAEGPSGHLERTPGNMSDKPHTSYSALPETNIGTGLAYIIYTSGSTGNPKGVVVEHRPVVNILTALQREYPLTKSDTYLFKTSYVFDVSVAELFGWFPGGGRLAVLQPGGEKEPGKIIDAVERFGVTHINFVPSMFNVFVEALDEGNTGRLASLKYIFLAGEALLPGVVERFGKLNIKIALKNIYGPTEGTVYSSSYSLSEYTGRGSIPIGRPVQNVGLYVLDRNDRIQPIGIPGELCIAGENLARGYLNQPELTNENFIASGGQGRFLKKLPLDPAKTFIFNKSFWPHLFIKRWATGGKKLYKTGDLVRWLPDGNVEYLGRMDDQVKVRGFRIELGEIESRLLKHEGIKEAVVIPRGDKTGDNYLCAYIVVKNAGPAAENLNRYLSRSLPDYMIPSYFVQIEKMPRTPSGKIDRKVLPEPGIKAGKKYIAPRNNREKKLAAIWGGILDREPQTIGIDDHFFELGGHSLRATRLITKLHREFDVGVALSDFFKNPTIKWLSLFIEKTLKKERFISIKTAEDKEYYPLSVTQKRFFFFQQLEPATISYNMGEILLMEGRVERERFATTFERLIHRHESLRTSFTFVDGKPVQKIHKARDITFAVEYPDFDFSLKNGSHFIDFEQVSSLFIRPFDLSRAPLLRIGLIRVEEEKFVLMVDMHHIISDGTSTGIFIADFLSIYKGEEPSILRIRYRDYALWLPGRTGKNRESGREPGSAADDVVEELLELPTDYMRPAVQSFAGAKVGFETGREETLALEAFALGEETTLFMVLFAIFNVFLSRLSGQDNVVVGSPIAGRLHDDLEGIMGLFINTLTIRNFASPEKSFSRFLTEVRGNLLRAFEEQEYQYEILVEKIETGRDSSRNPLFDVMFVLQNMELPEVEIPGLKIKRKLQQDRASKFDMTLYCEEQGDILSFELEYSTSLFKPATIVRYITYFKNILSALVRDPAKKIGDIEFISDKEKREILYDFNDKEVPYPEGKTIYRLFEEQAARTPENPAIMASTEQLPGPVGDAYMRPADQERRGEPGVPPNMSPETGPGHSLNYRELNERANRLSRVLRAKGVKANAIVGIMLERSAELIVALYAVLKAGGAYLPIDPEYPESRILSMLENSRAVMLVTGKDVVRRKKLSGISREIVYVDENDGDITGQSGRNLQPISLPTDLIYVIFTSGSTGIPKGAGVYQRSFVNLMHWFVTDFALNESDSNLLMTSFSFDLTQKNLYASLILGGTLNLPAANYFDPGEILRDIEENKVTWINCTPSMFFQLIEFCKDDELKKLQSLRYVYLGGEPISIAMFMRWLDSEDCHGEIVNTYGPTECTDISNFFRIKEPHRYLREPVPIGGPVYNVRLAVVDRNLKLLPVGFAGELLIAGESVGAGYLNDRELTERKFVSCSFEEGKPGRVYYRTGDLVKWLPDGPPAGGTSEATFGGRIEFIGRMDYQVKIRGFRIEIGEIESRLLEHEAIKEAVVVDRDDESGGKYLCAYVVTQEPGSIEGARAACLREYLSRTLPDYMIPSYFTKLAELPLNPNGKVNRKALPVPEIISEREYTAPRSDLENRLAKIWAEILGLEKGRIGIDDNFFELGGHSLKAAELMALIHKEFDVNIKLVELFTISTIRKLSKAVGSAVKTEYSSLEAVEEREYFPLSSVQKRLYFLQQMMPESTGYNIPAVMLLAGGLQKERLHDTFAGLIDRHEIFRTSFTVFDEQPVQRINNPQDIEFNIEYYEAGIREKQETGAEIPSLGGVAVGRGGLGDPNPGVGARRAVPEIIDSFIRPFDLSRALLLRAGLIPLENAGHILMVDMHHIISDGTSMEIFVREFMALYAGEALFPLRIHYKDYSEWQNSEEQKELLHRQEAYWLEQMTGEVPVLNLPLDYSRPGVQSFEGNRLAFEIGEKETRALKSLLLEEEVTSFMGLLSIYFIFLSKLSGQEEIIVGTPTVGRRHADLQGIIGMFVNTLPLRNFILPEQSFKELLEEIKKQVLKAFENQEYPFEDLVDKVMIERDAGRNPLFDAVFALQNIGIDEIEIPGLKLQPYEHENPIAKFDLTLMGLEAGDILSFELEYCSKLFKEETISRFIIFFKHLISSVAAGPGRRISELSILPDEEKQRVLYEFNDTKTEYPRDKTIHELFGEQVAHNPGRTAVIISRSEPGDLGSTSPKNRDVSITYSELDRKSTQVAHWLKKKGVQPGMIVAIMVDRSAAVLEGILGILKAGGAYLPIEPDYPEESRQYILDDSGAKVVISSNTAEIADDNPGTSEMDLKSVKIRSNLAYILYTSGSTGRPKGVIVEHRSVLRLVLNTNFVTFRPGDRLLQTGALSFDASTFEIWGPLLNNAALILSGRYTLLNPGHLKYLIRREHITILWMTAPLFNRMLMEDIKMFKGLKKLLVGGDVLSPSHIRQVKECYPGLAVINGYGPTENTTFSTTYPVAFPVGESIPIGKPIANSTVYIVDKYTHLLPVGVPGELVVGGDGVARGYLNQPELTSDKFIASGGQGSFFEKSPPCTSQKTFDYQEKFLAPPFFKKVGRRRQKFYKTGDLARWLPDGNVEFIGRIDQQVKIRGFRIEPGEIEKRLLDHPSVKEAVVLPRTNEGKAAEKYLCAYIVTGLEQVPDAAVLRDYISQKLPDYMVPAHFIFLKRLPLTANGKVNRKELPEPEFTVGEGYRAPRNPLETKLAEIFSEVLGFAGSIGIDDDFFESGGHSLKATIMTAKIHKELNVKVPLTEIFINPTIAGLAKTIEKTTGESYTSVAAVEKKEYYELSAAQKRLYILQQMEPGAAVYNLPAVYEVTGELDIDRLTAVIGELIGRHESFRTAFELKDNIPVQRIHDPGISFKVEHNKQPGEADNFIRPFDLSRAPLLRAGLFKTGEYGQLLMVDMHHIIADGTSMSVFVRDFVTIYEGKKLPGLRTRYRDYAEWLRKETVKETMRRQEAYWIDQMAGEIPVLNLPLDYPRPGVQSFEGNILTFELGEKETGALKSLVTEEEITLFMVLLAIFNVFLSKLSGQEDLIVGTPTAGRRHADLQQIIGMFVNTLALRNFIRPEQPFIEFLKEIKKRTLKAYENQEYSFEDLVDRVTIERDAGRNPLFDVMFTLQNIEFDEVEIPGLKLKPYKHENYISKFDLSLTAVETGGKLSFVVEYCSKLFKEETIFRFITFFKTLVSSVTAAPGQKISGLSILSEEEKHRLLLEFNDTGADYPKEKTLQCLFEDQVEKTPENAALIDPEAGTELSTSTGGVVLTYRVLNDKANRLACLIIEKNIKPGAIAAVVVERSMEMIIGIFAVLKAGCAYLPIEPAYPADRKQYMLKDSRAGILLTTRNLSEEVDPLRNLQIETIFIEEAGKSCPKTFDDGRKAIPVGDAYMRPETSTVETQHLASQPFEEQERRRASCVPPSLCADSGGLAYIIYTSGSTGKPKGVMVRHRSAVNIITALQRLYPLEESDTYLLKTSYIFDVSVAEIFGWFPGGGKLAVLKKGGEKDPEKIISAIESFAVTHINFVPSMFNVFVEALDEGNAGRLAALKYIFLAGEELLPELANRFRQFGTHIKLENIYGPTEGTVYTTNYSLSARDSNDRIPIGKPMQNIQLFILGKEDCFLPIGVPGELGIAGENLARGYLNQPELTAKNFIPTAWGSVEGPSGYLDRTRPHMHSESGVGARRAVPSRFPSRGGGPRSGGVDLVPTPNFQLIYKTGDLARWLPDGNIEYLGRIDNQVKIRGFRIELGEIENRLLKNDAVKEAVVIVKEESGREKYLCAYIVGDRSGMEAIDSPGFPVLREFLSCTLPDYMVPAYFVLLEKMPLNASGKIDRKALPVPDITKIGGGYTPPRNELEKKLVGIWADLLKIQPGSIGIDANFFHAGGHSLKAVQLTSRIDKEFSASIKLAEIFTRATIRQLSETIASAAKGKYFSLEAVEDREYYPLSSAQKRLYILQRSNPEGTGYNMPVALELTGKLEKEKFAGSFRKLLHRHESLRTSFRTIAGEAKQLIHSPENIEFEIEYYNELNKSFDRTFSKVRPPGGPPEAWPQALSPGHVVAPPEAINRFIRPFDLSAAPLMRAGLIPLEKDKHILVVDMHHIISDGTSMGILIRDFMTIYSGGEPEALPIRYRDYSEWQSLRKESTSLNDQGEYWFDQFAGDLPELNLPTDYPDTETGERNFAGDSLAFEIDAEETQSLKQLEKEEDATRFMVLLALYNILLTKLGGREDVMVGVPIVGRRHADLQQTMGMFVNTLALRNYPAREKTFKEFLKDVKDRTLQALENQDYQFDDLIDRLDHPLFSVMFSLLNLDNPELEIPGLKLRPYPFRNRISKFDLTLNAEERGDRLHFIFEYSTRLFREETIARFIRYFKEIVSDILENRDICLVDIHISLNVTDAQSEIYREAAGEFEF